MDQGTETCFLVRRALDSPEPRLGIDPELSLDQQELRAVRFRPLNEMQNDSQISRLRLLS